MIRKLKIQQKGITSKSQCQKETKLRLAHSHSKPNAPCTEWTLTQISKGTFCSLKQVTANPLTSYTAKVFKCPFR